MNTNSVWYKILHFPLTKIIIGFLVFGISIGILQVIVYGGLDFIPFPEDLKSLIGGVVISVLAIVIYIFLFKLYEKREITEFARSSFLKDLGLGIVIGSILQALTILVIYLYGGYEILSINPIWFLLPPLTMAVTSAIIEEILLRGIIFRITEEKLGSYIALLISAILFGAMHLGNPNSSLIAGVGLAIQAGLLLGASYIYSRNLWLPIGIHFAWNFTQSAIFGANVSGHAMSKTLVVSNMEGAEWITGGAFGPEGSIQATVFCSIVTIILLILSHKEGKIIKPFWSASHV